jgi:hypothetical protein
MQDAGCELPRRPLLGTRVNRPSADASGSARWHHVDPVKRVPRKGLNHAAYPILLRWCGVASVLGGVLFVAWGYIDRPDIPENLMAVIHVLAFVVPALLLAAVVGVSVLWGSRLGMLGLMGMALAMYAWGWRVVGLADWVLFMLTGLTLMGIATLRSGPSRRTGALVLATGVFGWVYYLTDSGAVLEARSVHIGFGLLYSLGWVGLGVGLVVAGARRAQGPQAGA